MMIFPDLVEYPPSNRSTTGEPDIPPLVVAFALAGTVDIETTAVRTGGASDGATGGFSYALTAIRVSDNVVGVISPWMRVWVEGDGAAKTLTVFIANDDTESAGNLLQDDEVFLEVGFPSEAGISQYDYRPNESAPLSGTLDYDAQSANFTVGATLTGGTSGAHGIITADVDAGSTGTLTLEGIDGTFQNDETITDDNGSPGSATSDGTLTTTFQSGRMQLLGTAVNLTTTSETWGTGANNDQKLTQSIAPDYQGWLYCRVHFSKSATPPVLFVDLPEVA